MLKGASERGAKRIRVHILTDGRDVLDGSSVGFVETLENDLAKLREKGIDAQIASGGGRMNVTMDRYEVCNGIAFDVFVDAVVLEIYCFSCGFCFRNSFKHCYILPAYFTNIKLNLTEFQNR